MPAPPPTPHLLPIKDTPSLPSHPTPPLTILLSKSSFSVLAWEGYALLISFLKLQLTKVDSPHTSPTSLLPPHALRFGSHGQNRHQAKVQQLSMADELRSTNARCSLCLSQRVLAVYPLWSLFSPQQQLVLCHVLVAKPRTNSAPIHVKSRVVSH